MVLYNLKSLTYYTGYPFFKICINKSIFLRLYTQNVDFLHRLDFLHKAVFGKTKMMKERIFIERAIRARKTAFSANQEKQGLV